MVLLLVCLMGSVFFCFVVTSRSEFFKAEKNQTLNITLLKANADLTVSSNDKDLSTSGVKEINIPRSTPQLMTDKHEENVNDHNDTSLFSIPGKNPVGFRGPSNSRQSAVVKAFLHSWKGYKKFAWGHDNLKPISKKALDWFGLGLTIVDSLDTMYIMNLQEEFNESSTWVKTHLTFDVNRDVNLFEVTIRVLGGLLSAFHLSKDPMFLVKATDLGERLLPCFDSPSGIPYSDVNLATRRAHSPKWSPDSSTSEVTTLQLEFRDLSASTGRSIFQEVGDKVNHKVHILKKFDGLVPIFINANTGTFRNDATISLGARGDSYYEYLLKQWIQTGRNPNDYRIHDYKMAVEGVLKHLTRKTSNKKYTFLGELINGRDFKPKMDHLSCYLPGTLVLGFKYGMPVTHLQLANELLETCYQMYIKQPTHLAPEIAYFNFQDNIDTDINVKASDAHNLLRPEFVESLYYFYVITGNVTYQDMGWQIFEAFEKYTKVTNGYTSIGNVKNEFNIRPRDMMESFWLGETLKYFYLLFSSDRFEIDLDRFLVLLVALLSFDFELSILSCRLLWIYFISYMCVLAVSSAVELLICIVSMKGSILNTEPRASMQYLVYIKSCLILFDIVWIILGLIWVNKFYDDMSIGSAKEILLGLLISNWLLVVICLITVWCTYDTAGRSWVKMKAYQQSLQDSESRFTYKRSGNTNRNWRQRYHLARVRLGNILSIYYLFRDRKVIRAYQDSWDHRCRLLFCCVGASQRSTHSFTDIARLLSDFFRELDIVPSDVVAGLILLRKFQKLERHAIIRQRKNGTYGFFSGVPINERTQFLELNDAKEVTFFQTIIHYMHFAEGAYGWPMYLMTHGSGICHLCSGMRCCFALCGQNDRAEIIKDNCCQCNYAALRKMLQVGEIEVIYATYHVDIGETPFFVAIDYLKKKVVISIRGTLSMKDVLTDLNAESDIIPLEPPVEEWLGHKGMIEAAIYIKKKLEEENLVQKALTHNRDKDTQNFGLVLVGHSLGAGTASILAILLKPQHPSLQCFSYSPPGGLLSMPAVEYSKSFITSIVLGKDVVPRIGLHQMEALRADLINAIKRSIDAKWKTIICSALCCGCAQEPSSVVEMCSHDAIISQYTQQRDASRAASIHPTDSSIALTIHQPLYPPGRIIHIVRSHHKRNKRVLKMEETAYHALWADTKDFDEVLISPVMLQDHMPDKVLAALNKVNSGEY